MKDYIQKFRDKFMKPSTSANIQADEWNNPRIYPKEIIEWLAVMLKEIEEEHSKKLTIMENNASLILCTQRDESIRNNSNQVKMLEIKFEDEKARLAEHTASIIQQLIKDNN